MTADCAAETSEAITKLDSILLYLIVFVLRTLIEREMVAGHST